MIDLITALLFAFLVYRDIAHRSDMGRKDEMLGDLELKLMSRNTDEYLRASTPEQENMEPVVEDIHIPIEDISDEDFYGAEDRL